MKIIYTFVILTLSLTASGQNVLSLYNMKHIPQVVNANPAFVPLGRLNISIPTLGSTYANIGKTDFDTDVATVDQNGVLRLDTKKFLDGLEDENALYAGVTYEALHVGFTAGKNYIFLAAKDNISSEFIFPREAAIMISQVFDDLGLPTYVDIQGLGLNYSHYKEFSFGWARKVNEKWSFGARFKLLSGIADFRTNTSGILIDGVSAEDLSGLISVDIQTSGVDNYFDEISKLNDVSNFVGLLNLGYGMENLGYSLDFGAEYKITPKIKVAASVLDLAGTITWKQNIENYKVDSLRVDFNTVDWGSIANPGEENGGGFGDLLDSIITNTDPETARQSYTSQIPTRVLGSFTYYIAPKIEATLVGQGVFAENYFQPYLRIGIQGRVNRFLNYMVSYSIVDNRSSAQNLGLGLAVNLGPLQLHALTDNIFDPYLFSTSFNPTLRFGLNLTFGRDHE